MSTSFSKQMQLIFHRSFTSWTNPRQSQHRYVRTYTSSFLSGLSICEYANDLTHFVLHYKMGARSQLICTCSTRTVLLTYIATLRSHFEINIPWWPYIIRSFVRGWLNRWMGQEKGYFIFVAYLAFLFWGWVFYYVQGSRETEKDLRFPCLDFRQL